MKSLGSYFSILNVSFTVVVCALAKANEGARVDPCRPGWSLDPSSCPCSCCHQGNQLNVEKSKSSFFGSLRRRIEPLVHYKSVVSLECNTGLKTEGSLCSFSIVWLVAWEEILLNIWFAKSQVREVMGGYGIEAVITKVERCLENGKLLEAAATLEKGLEGTKGEEIVAEWVRQARNRVVAEQALTMVQAHAIAVASALV